MDELIGEFLTETNESLGALDLDMVRLEQNPNDKELISSIFRLMHTIKGTCGFLGLPRLETVAHRAENVMGRFRDGDLKVTPAYVTLIFESFDRIKQIVSGLEATGSEPQGDDSELIAKLDAVYEGRDGNTENAKDGSKGDAAIDELQALFDATPVLSPDQWHTIVTVPETDDHKMEEEEAKPAAVEKTEDHGAKAPVATAESLRVNVDVLEDLMTLVSELVLTRNQLLQTLRNKRDNVFSAPLQRLSHVVTDLQEGVMKTRMQPIGNAWSKLPRIIRDLSMELNKKIDLVMEGEATELDRQILEMIKDPLTHMVRNSADHGVEMPADRIAKGKPETGRIVLKAYHEGGHIIIEITDDGKGLPLAKIKEKIIKNGLATEEEVAAMSDQSIQQYIFKAGFSTAEKVTSVSGRGVGMDVVRNNIEKIGGSIVLKSVEGKGSTFLIKIPLTLAIVSALIVEAGGEKFAIPQLAVRELVRTTPTTSAKIEEVNGTPFYRLRDHLLPLVSLRNLLELGGEARANQYIVVTQIGAYQFGIIVDKVFDTEEIVVKPVAKVLKNLEVFSGNTILGDGSVIMILDPNGVAKASGETDIADATPKEMEKTGPVREKTPLLLFATNDSAPKAVPLSLVARLEEIKTSDIETSGGKMMIQYRGQLMPLTPFDTSVDMRTKGKKPILVFHDDANSMGLVVEKIIDITEEFVDVQVASDHGGIVGSAIINGKATDVVDIGYFVRNTDRDWFKSHGEESYGQQTTQGRRVLLVDDSPFFRNMLTPLLKVAGYDVTTLDSAATALKMREDGERFDIIVSDIEMPHMNGFEFAQKVREEGSTWLHTPMVALTSHTTEQDVHHGMEVGFSRYIAKFDRDTLLATLTETLVANQSVKHAAGAR